MNARRLPATFRYAVFFTAVFIPALLLFTTVWIERTFSRVSIEAIVFTMATPLGKASTELVGKYMLFVGMAAAFSLIVTLFFFFLRRVGKRAGRILAVLAPTVFFLFSLSYFDRSYGLLDYVRGTAHYDRFIDDHYATPEESVLLPEKKKNMILLVLESMENTFHEDRVVGHSLLPNLRRLQVENIAFEEHLPVRGTDWTIAGLTASLFGLPLFLPIDKNSYNYFERFLPHAASVHGILENEGYDVSLIMGSHSEFSGIRNLFETHCPKVSIFDARYFLDTMRPGEELTALSQWGVRDSYMYARSKDLLTSLSRTGKPFFAVMMTLDTHVKGVSYGDAGQRYGDDRDSFVAADGMASEFIAWLREQPFYSDTVVVLVGDHPYMAKRVGPVSLKSARRKIYNVFLNTGREVMDNERERFISSFDIAPTLLESLGARLPGGRFGLGVSLFSGEPTLMERYGQREMDRRLGKRSQVYEGLF